MSRNKDKRSIREEFGDRLFSVSQAAYKPIKSGTKAVGDAASAIAESRPGKIAQKGLSPLTNLSSLGYNMGLYAMRNSNVILIEYLGHELEFSKKINEETIEYLDNQLKQYDNSYNLDRFKNLAFLSAENIRQLDCVKHFGDDGNRNVEPLKIKEFSEVSDSIKECTSDQITNLDLVISGAIPNEINKIKGPNGIEGKFLEVTNRIAQNDSEFRRPGQLEVVLNELREQTISEIINEKTRFSSEIRKNLENESSKKNIADQLKVNNTDPLVTQFINNIVKHFEADFEKSEAKIREFYAGKPASKKDDTEIPEIVGMNEKIQNAKTTSTIDLLKRIELLEELEKRGTPFFATKLTGTIKNYAGEENKEEQETNLLRNTSLEDLINKFQKTDPGAGKSHFEYTSRTGSVIKFEADGGKTLEMKVKPQWFKSDKEWSRWIRAEYEDVASIIIAKQKDQDKPTINFSHYHPNDKNRKLMVIESYKAARRKGISPENITMSVGGGQEENKDDKKNFPSMSAPELLKKLGLEDIEEEFKNEKKNLEQVGSETINKNQKSDSLNKDTMNNLKLNSQTTNDSYEKNTSKTPTSDNGSESPHC